MRCQILNDPNGSCKTHALFGTTLSVNIVLAQRTSLILQSFKLQTISIHFLCSVHCETAVMAEQHQPATSGPSLVRNAQLQKQDGTCKHMRKTTRNKVHSTAMPSNALISANVVQATISRCSSLSDRSDSSHRACTTNENSSSIPVDALASHVSCGLCSGPVASSLLLSCSHLFCGDCISRHLLKTPACPTCNMDLRAIPVRCLAMDKVAASVVPSLTPEQQQHYARRKKDGQCAADKVNKMFWYLAPSALPSAVGAAGLGVPGAAPLLPSCMALPAASLEFPGNGLPLDPKTPRTLQGLTGPTHNRLQPPYGSAVPYGVRAAPGAAATASSAPLLQLAVAAQQMAHAQQVAHMQQLAHMHNMHLNPACHQMAPGSAAVGYAGGQDLSAFMGASMSLAGPGMSGYHDLQQLSSMMGNLCQV